MLNPEMYPLPIEEIETANFLWEETTDLDRRTYARLKLERLNIPVVKIPIGGEKGLEHILSFMDKAIQGLAISTRAGKMDKNAFRKITEFVPLFDQSGINSTLWVEIEALGIELPKEVSLPNKEFLLAVAGHAIATLALLGKLEVVNYQTMGLKERITDQKSVWQKKWTLPDIFTTFAQIRENTQSMIVDTGHCKDMGNALKTAHFHAASALVADHLLKQLL